MVEEIHVRRRPALPEHYHPFGLRREVRKSGLRPHSRNGRSGRGEPFFLQQAREGRNPDPARCFAEELSPGDVQRTLKFRVCHSECPVHIKSTCEVVRTDQLRFLALLGMTLLLIDNGN
jgi:hypothetical protein